MDYKLLFIQSLGFIGTAVYLLSYQFKHNNDLFRMQLISYIFYATHFFFLQAYTGALSSLVALIRAYFLVSKNENLHTKYACVFICLLQVSVGVFTFESIYSLFPIIANVSLTIAGFINNPKKIRLVGLLINAPLWIAYDAIVGSWAGVIDELITAFSIIVSIIRYRFNDDEDVIK